MKPSIDALKEELKRRNVNLSHQRLKVLEYLVRNQCHPTADQIYTDLRKSIPTLSRTTVYNTLKMLIDAGLVRAITIEDNEARYDIIPESHGHFKCASCGAIYNFGIDAAALASGDLAGFLVTEKNVYFKGICPGCLGRLHEKKED